MEMTFENVCRSPRIFEVLSGLGQRPAIGIAHKLEQDVCPGNPSPVPPATVGYPLIKAVAESHE
jgi:hypothetical protein